MKLLLPRLARLLLLVVAASSLLRAGTTGKIAGVATEKKTGEPLVGVNVIVVGTTFGTTTDLNGEYTILHVLPGTYDLLVSSVGYTKVTLKGVRVEIDQTARVNIVLEPQTVELGETVIIAERNIVKPDVATSVVSVNDHEIAAMPVSSVSNILGMQAGIKDGQIRGSGMDQALFMIDGVTMRDPRNNQAITKVAMSSVKEVSVERGGFTAEYGQVQAGIINVVTNEGKAKGYSGSFIGRFTPPAAKYFTGSGIPDIHDANSYWMRPYLDPAVCWTGTTTSEANGGWDVYTQKKYPVFDGWNKFSQQLLSDNNPNNDLTPLAAQRVFEYETRKAQVTKQPDFDIDASFGGPVPFIAEPLGDLRFFTSYRSTKDVLMFPMSRPDYTDYDWRMMVSSDITSAMRLRVSALVGNVGTMEDNWNKGNYIHWPYEIAGAAGSDVGLMFGGATFSLTDIGHRSLSAKLTHTLSAQTFYEVSVENLQTKYDSRPPAARDLSQLTEVVPGFFESMNPFGYYPGISDGIFFTTLYHQSLARDNSVSSATTVKADMTSQVDFSNMVKGGIEFDYTDLNLDYGYIQFLQSDPNKYSSRVQMRNFPIRAAAYIQDKYEAKGFTLNVGLRADYSDAKAVWWNSSQTDQSFYTSTYANTTSYSMVDPKAQWQLSPRLGISHPITEDSKLYFNYGHFKQMPQYEAAFRFDRRSDNSLARIGDPNLTLAKTISYELGYDHRLFENLLLVQLTAFYRDISNQQNTTHYFPDFGQDYYVTTSTGYQDVRGFEFTLRKPTGPWVYGFVNFTYQATSNGNFGTSEVYSDPAKQVSQYDDQPNKYYQSRYVPTPYSRANITVETPVDFGPVLFGENIFGNVMANILLNWSQGGWETYNPKAAQGVSNNVQNVDYFDGTLRLSKALDFNHIKLQFYADISNLFDLKRLRTTNDVGYRNSLHLPKSEAYDNIPGNDKFGDYRDPSVAWTPIEYQADMGQTKLSVGTSHAMYYEGNTQKYWQYIDDASLPLDQRWVVAPQATVDKMLKDKSYIDNPGPSTFWFLNPRAITYGIHVSFDLD